LLKQIARMNLYPIRELCRGSTKNRGERLS
jgi:hypothetical protein